MRCIRLSLLWLSIATLQSAVSSVGAQCPTMNATNVFVTYSNTAGTCTHNNNSGCLPGAPIAFNVGSFGYNFECAAHTVSWNFGDGSPVVSGMSASHAFRTWGPYLIAATVTRVGQTFTADAALVVCPVMDATVFVSASCTSSCTARTPISFSVRSYPRYPWSWSKNSWKFQWTFSDGFTTMKSGADEMASDVEHAFVNNGTYTVRCAISNGAGIAYTTSAATITVGSSGPPACSPNIVPPALPDARVADFYSIQLSATGMTPPQSFTMTAGALPKGLSMSASGLISGTPTDEGHFTFVVRAANQSGCATTLPYNIDVNPVCSEITVLPVAHPPAAPGASYSSKLEARGGTPPFTFSVTSGSLPPGIHLVADKLAGSATAPGLFVFEITAVDATGCAESRTYEIEVRVSECPLMIEGTKVAANFFGTLSGCSPSQTTCRTGETIAFGPVTTAYDFACGPHSFSWNFGDGQLAAGQQVSHTYRAVGAYRVELTISNPQQIIHIGTDVKVEPARRRAVHDQ